ncbi:MAG: IS1634 family transposase [Actinomycetota bacterium]|nr:IS1634 family transposase [Actinomycetota bacterium]MDQ3680555.1 IS1634 family transposase [Actinomycetota bacterium]
MAEPGTFELRSESVASLPVINHFLTRMGLGELLERHLPHDDARLRLAPATVIALVVRNLIVAHQPLYALGEWAGAYQPALLGLGPGEAAALNDDRVGRMLDRLFDADRASLMTGVVLGAVGEFGVELSQLHNDSTTLTFSGNYAGATGGVRGNKATPAITHGHNKDHRPDLKQLVCVLTVSADGAVPIAFRTEDGNTADDVTHIPTWDELRALVGRADFLYVADCKLANRAAMDHIASHGGRFVTVLPRSRREDAEFRDWLFGHQPEWIEAQRRPRHRHGDAEETWHTTPALSPSAEGYSIIWVRSSAKIDRDGEARRARIAKGIAALDDLNQRLASPRTRIKTVVAVQAAATAALDHAGASRWIGFEVTETTEESLRQEKRGRPGSNTRYRKLTRTHHRVAWQVREDVVARDAASDGCFPLITNDSGMAPAEVLAAYRYQPNLERRNHMLKGPQQLAPVYLKAPHRIEALLLCQFLALLTEALIEREIRTAMKTAELKAIPLYPELRSCPAPSGPRVLEIFNGIARHHLISQGRVVQVFEPTLTALQHQVLDLLGIPAATYTGASAGDGAV